MVSSALLSAVDLSAGSPVYKLATDLVIISIVLAALALGISRALGSRKLWTWGAEELAQALINAALLGVLVAWAAGSSALVSGVLPASALAACPSASTSLNSPLTYDLCALDHVSASIHSVSGALMAQSFKLGMLAKMQVSADVVTASPFDALTYPSKAYADWTFSLSALLSSLEIQRQFLMLVASSAFSIFLPVGLVLRLFFPTRKLGGALMGASIGFFLIYPLAYSALLSLGPASGASQAALSSLSDLSQATAIIPQLDFGKSPQLVQMVSNLSGTDIASLAFGPYASVSSLIGVLQLQLVLYPLLALGITFASIWELSMLLGGEFSLGLFKEI